jgi:hypothetical protein
MCVLSQVALLRAYAPGVAPELLERLSHLFAGRRVDQKQNTNPAGVPLHESCPASLPAALLGSVTNRTMMMMYGFPPGDLFSTFLNLQLLFLGH